MSRDCLVSKLKSGLKRAQADLQSARSEYINNAVGSKKERELHGRLMDALRARDDARDALWRAQNQPRAVR